MIVFFPRDIGLWRNHFDFHPPITLAVKGKTDHQGFRDREELIEFLKEHGVRLDNPEHPLQFVKTSDFQRVGEFYPGDLHMVVTWTVLGWFKDDYK